MLQMGISEHFVEIQPAAACRTVHTGTNPFQCAAIGGKLLDVEAGFVRRHTNLGAIVKLQMQQRVHDRHLKSQDFQVFLGIKGVGSLHLLQQGRFANLAAMRFCAHRT